MPTNVYSDLENKAGFLKRLYRKSMENQENLSTGILKYIDKADEKPFGASTGGGAYFSIKYEGNWGINAIAETQALSTAGSEKAVQGVIYPKIVTGRIKLTGLAMASMDVTGAAWVKALADEMASVGKRIMKLTNYHMYRDGYGSLAVLTSGSASGSNVTVTTTAPDYVGMVREGMYLDFMQSNTSTSKIHASADNMRVSSVDRANNQFTVVCADGTAATNVVAAITTYTTAAVAILAADRDSTANPWFHGFLNSFDDGATYASYLGVNRSTYTVWKGNVLSNSGTVRDVSEDLLQEMLDAREVDVGDEVGKVKFVCNQGQRRKILEMVLPARRYGSPDFKTGHEHLDFNGIEIIVDTDCPKRRIFLPDFSQFKKFQLLAPTWGNNAGQFFTVSGFDMIDSYVREYVNYGTKRCNANVIASDMAEPGD